MRPLPRQDSPEPTPRADPQPTDKPRPEWREVDGRMTRIYQCRYCRDATIVLLPAYKPGETDAELLDWQGASKSTAWACPNCRGLVPVWSRGVLTNGGRQRLTRWYHAKKAAMENEAAQEALERIDRAKIPNVIQTMARLSTFESDEIAAAERAAQGGE